jgi:hypothetical protein
MSNRASSVAPPPQLQQQSTDPVLRAALQPEALVILNDKLLEFFAAPVGSPHRESLWVPLREQILRTLSLPCNDDHLALVAFALGAGNVPELVSLDKPRGSFNASSLAAIDAVLAMPPSRAAHLWAEVLAGGRLYRPPAAEQHYCLVHASTLSQAMARVKSRWQCGFPTCALQPYPSRACPSFALAGACLPRPAQVPRCTLLHIAMVEGLPLLFPPTHTFTQNVPATAEAFRAVAIDSVRVAATRTAAQASLASMAQQRLASNQSTGRLENLARLMTPRTPPAKRQRDQ